MGAGVSSLGARCACAAAVAAAGCCWMAARSLARRGSRADRALVVLTGCDSGLGFSLALRALARGAVVLAACLDERGPGAARLRQAGATVAPLDVTDGDSVQRLARRAADLVRDDPGLELIALVNNAGVMVFGEFEWQTERLIRHQVEVNLLGTMRVTKAFCPLIRQHKGQRSPIAAPHAFMGPTLAEPACPARREDRDCDEPLRQPVAPWSRGVRRHQGSSGGLVRRAARRAEQVRRQGHNAGARLLHDEQQPDGAPPRPRGGDAAGHVRGGPRLLRRLLRALPRGLGRVRRAARAGQHPGRAIAPHVRGGGAVSGPRGALPQLPAALLRLPLAVRARAHLRAGPAHGALHVHARVARRLARSRQPEHCHSLWPEQALH
ncbi:uncharacterized protein LOC134530196 isoform X1 [Bacillus rossius redtenbacheri]|uniref:uncharacterized protein LOC134530196 isoform X1 n=1 Tax=Bacillus rossius redtenbacheri TaxID=93214 RepID=UPI002FDCD104